MEYIEIEVHNKYISFQICNKLPQIWFPVEPFKNVYQMAENINHL